MKKLSEHLGIQTKGLLGIEIECEGRNLNPIDTAFWKTEDDGSLRGDFPDGRSEYVLKKPILYKDLDACLDQLIEHQKDATLNFSFRTSVHIHVNCLDLNEEQITAFAYSYYLFEKVLMEYCGESRKSNRFCLRLLDAEGQLDSLMELAVGGINAVHGFIHDHVRYASMNLAPLNKYGSIEFRGMRGTLDKEILTTWINMLVSLREWSTKLGNPLAVYERSLQIPFEEMALEALGPAVKKLLYPTAERDFLEGLSLSIEIPFEYNKTKQRAKEIEARPKKVAPRFVFDPAAAPQGQWAPQVGGIPENQAPPMVPRNRRPAPRIVVDDNIEPVNPDDINF